jgi:hypothetical protein
MGRIIMKPFILVFFLALVCATVVFSQDETTPVSPTNSAEIPPIEDGVSDTTDAETDEDNADESGEEDTLIEEEAEDLNGDENLVKEDFTEQIKLILLLSVVALSLASVVLIILGFFFTRKRIGKEIQQLKNEIMEESRQSFNKIETEIKSISRTHSVSTPDNSWRIDDLESKVKNLERTLKQQEDDIHLLKNPIIKEPPPPPPTSSEILTHFNNWAANPSSALSSKLFYYLTGDVKMRTIQAQLFKNESLFPTMWIINREGNIKFVFPNPNFFDQRTDITMLYSYDLAQLKIKGQNRIKILDPCKISDEGFIEFPGKLQLL